MFKRKSNRCPISRAFRIEMEVLFFTCAVLSVCISKMNKQALRYIRKKYMFIRIYFCVCVLNHFTLNIFAEFLIHELFAWILFFATWVNVVFSNLDFFRPWIPAIEIAVDFRQHSICSDVIKLQILMVEQYNKLIKRDFNSIDVPHPTNLT